MGPADSAGMLRPGCWEPAVRELKSASRDQLPAQILCCGVTSNPSLTRKPFQRLKTINEKPCSGGYRLPLELRPMTGLSGAPSKVPVRPRYTTQGSRLPKYCS